MTRDSLRLDSRGVSEVIGSILVFGLVVALVSMLQVQAIPNANQEVEFEHNNQVSNDMADLQVAISESVDTGRTKEANLKLGADYPPRLLFFNPPSANGRLRTSDTASITLRRVSSSGSTSEFFESSSTIEYSTRALEYTIDYRELSASPARVREPAVYYEQHANETLVKESGFIDGREISLVAIGGTLTAGGVNSETIAVRPVSAPAEEYTVHDDGSGPINITVPTKLSAEKWNETLRGEYASGATVFGTTVAGGGGFVQKVTYNETAGEFDELHVELVPGREYVLRTAKVGFGSGGDPTPAYIVSVPESDSNTATIEVRDRFNNPVSGVTVWANTSSGTLSNGTTTGSNLRVMTGPDGRATIRRTGTGATTVEFSEDLDDNGTTTATLETETVPFAGANGPILLADVTGASGSDTISLDIVNEGTERQVTRVQTHYVTQVESQRLAESADLVTVVGSTVLSSLNRVNNTNVTDGPDAVTAVGGTSLNSNAVEGEGPASVTGGPTVPTGTSTLSLTFDENYVLNEKGAILVEVTVFYEGGHRERYTVHLFENEA